MRIALTLAGILAAAVGFAYWKYPLQTFSVLMPHDPGSRSVAEGVAYGAHPRRKLDIYAPVDAGDARLPVIVWFYGGSWASGQRSSYDFAGRALAAQGFVSVVPDYRLVPEVRFPGFVEDGAQAVRWVRENIGEYGGDPDNIVLMGHSAGGYIAAMLASDPRWLGNDRTALVGLLGLAGPYDFVPFTSDEAKAAFGEWPEPMDTQPVTFADAGNPPALLLTGAEDSTVYPRNSEALAARLRAAGVPVELKEYPGVGHIAIMTSIARPLRGQVPVLEDAVRFAREVTDAPAP